MIRTIRFADVLKQFPDFAVYETTLTQDDLAGKHTHYDFCELFVVTKGKLLHHINNTSSMMERGDFRLIYSTDVHEILRVPEEEATIVNISFSTDYFERLRKELGFGDEAYAFSGTLTSSEMLVTEEMLAAVMRPEPLGDSRLYQKQALLKVTLEALLLSCASAAQRHSREIPAWLTHTVDSLQKTAILQKGIHGLLDICGLSQAHFCRQVRKYYGQTPSQIVNRYRINYAQKLLTTTDLPILDIALQVGFESISYFNRVFVETVGLSPSKYRRSCRSIV